MTLVDAIIFTNIYDDYDTIDEDDLRDAFIALYERKPDPEDMEDIWGLCQLAVDVISKDYLIINDGQFQWPTAKNNITRKDRTTNFKKMNEDDYELWCQRHPVAELFTGLIVGSEEMIEVCEALLAHYSEPFYVYS